MPAEFERLQQQEEEPKKEERLIEDDKIIDDDIILEQAVPNVTEEDAAQAEAILNFLESPSKDLEIETPEALSVFDLHRDVQNFQRQIAVVSALELEVPGLSIDEGSPVPVRFDVPSTWSLLAGRDEEAKERYRELLESYDVVMPVEEAKASFHLRASAFLATRIAGIRMWAAGDWHPDTFLQMRQSLWNKSLDPTPGCDFTVTTKNHGLRVLWSGAYYISKRYFGSPTTPARSVLQSGVYIFGVDGGAYVEPEWDDAKIVLPGPHSSVHLNF